MHDTHWTELCRPFSEREMGLQVSRHNSLRYWAGNPNQHRQTSRLYRWIRIGAAQRDLCRSNDERFLAPGYDCLPYANWLRRYFSIVLSEGGHFWYKGDDGLWWLGKTSATTPTDGEYILYLIFG